MKLILNDTKEFDILNYQIAAFPFSDGRLDKNLTISLDPTLYQVENLFDLINLTVEHVVVINDNEELYNRENYWEKVSSIQQNYNHSNQSNELLIIIH